MAKSVSLDAGRGCRGGISLRFPPISSHSVLPDPLRDYGYATLLEKAGEDAGQVDLLAGRE